MRCQFIESSGDFTRLSDEALDRLKCGRPTVDRACPWCPEHVERVFRRDGDDVEPEGEAAVA